ncbi:stomatin-like protein 3 isoform X3 [Prinia subflava]|uniref:stomatin-like protein 3 isoform X3 n=1 Tax=Prinia subflava TaxID=208062 RepID=UPI002FE192C2
MYPQRERPKEMNTEHLIADRREGIGVCGWILVSLSFLLVLITFPISIWACIKVVREYERAVVFRLGRILSKKAKGPGPRRRDSLSCAVPGTAGIPRAELPAPGPEFWASWVPSAPRTQLAPTRGAAGAQTEGLSLGKPRGRGAGTAPGQRQPATCARAAARAAPPRRERDRVPSPRQRRTCCPRPPDCRVLPAPPEAHRPPAAAGRRSPRQRGSYGLWNASSPCPASPLFGSGGPTGKGEAALQHPYPFSIAPGFGDLLAALFLSPQARQFGPPPDLQDDARTPVFSVASDSVSSTGT